jgi:hypothetical protein
MNRNQKIALGCGGAGCLGLIVVAVAGILFYSFMARSSATNRNYNFNPNSNSNANRSTNRNSNMNSAPSSSSSMSDDDKHKLFQAAGMTKDSALIQRALQKIGFMDANGTPTAGYEQFVKDHFAWALKNTQFVMSVNTEEKARAYVNEHLDN